MPVVRNAVRQPRPLREIVRAVVREGTPATKETANEALAAVVAEGRISNLEALELSGFRTDRPLNPRITEVVTSEGWHKGTEVGHVLFEALAIHADGFAGAEVTPEALAAAVRQEGLKLVDERIERLSRAYPRSFSRTPEGTRRFNDDFQARANELRSQWLDGTMPDENHVGSALGQFLSETYPNS